MYVEQRCNTKSTLTFCDKGPPLNMCVRVATDMRLFRIIDKRDPSPITSEELAEACGADRSLLGTSAIST